jgi:hypothetical protein
VQGELLSLALTSPVPVEGQLVRGEVRTQAGGRLLLDLSLYLSVSPADPYVLLLDVPAEVTSALLSSGVYDVWVGGERIAFGPWLLEWSVSRLPGRVLLPMSWTPVLVAGEPFTRKIELAGLFPQGEEVSVSDEGSAPEFVILGVDGSPVFEVKGEPWARVLTDGKAVDLALSGVDTASIGHGRFSYSLVVFNVYGERRTVLAGMLLVEDPAYTAAVEEEVVTDGVGSSGR